MAEVVKYAGVDLRSAGVFMSVADGVVSPPPVRGKNLQIPYMDGQRWTRKYYDERVVVLTGELGSLVSRTDMQTKLDTLKALFPIGSGEQKLEIQRADGSYRYVMAEVRNTMGLQWFVWPTRTVPYSIELVASDPFWYGSALEASAARTAWTFDSGVLLDDGAHWFDTTAPFFIQTLTSTPVNVEASNAGNYFTRRPVFTLKGAMVNPKFVNLRNGYSLQINLTTTGNDTLVIDCGAQTLSRNGQPQPLSSVVLGPGQMDWMHLETGENTLQITLGVASPSVAYQAQYSPLYL